MISLSNMIQIYLYFLDRRQDGVHFRERIEHDFAIFAQIATASDKVARNGARIIRLGIPRSRDGKEVRVCFPAVGGIAAITVHLPPIRPQIQIDVCNRLSLDQANSNRFVTLQSLDAHRRLFATGGKRQDGCDEFSFARGFLW